jgi:hypothetical protein
MTPAPRIFERVTAKGQLPAGGEQKCTTTVEAIIEKAFSVV